MAYNFSKSEEIVQKLWKDNKIFEKSLIKNKDCEPFIFYDGPPFATGKPHFLSPGGSHPTQKQQRLKN